MLASVGAQRTAYLGVAAILLLQSVLLAFHLTGPAIWQDEALSYYVAVDGPLAAVERISHDTQGPLYYVTLSLWMGLGHDLLTMRLLSVVATMIATVFVFAGTRALAGVGVGLLAAGLFAISPETVLWAQKVRPYALQTMFVAISWWGFCRAVALQVATDPAAIAGVQDADDVAGRIGGRFRLDPNWIVYAVFAGLAMLTQHPAGFYILGCCLAVLCVFGRNPRRNRVFLINWFIAHCLAAAIWLSWLPIFLSQAAAHLTADAAASKHPHFIVGSVWSVLGRQLGSDFIWTGLPLLIAINIGLIIYGALRAHTARSSVILAHYTSLIPLLICSILFYAIGPLFGYVILVFKWEQVLLAILLAYGALQIKPVWGRLIIIAALVAFQVRGLTNHYGIIPHRHDMVSEIIRQEARPGDLTIFNRLGMTHLALAYYLRSASLPLGGLEPAFPYRGLVGNAEATACHDRIWTIIADGDPPAVGYSELETTAALAFERRVGGMLIRRYDRTGPSRKAGAPCG